MQELKGKKLVLFGAGRSGEIFAENAEGLRFWPSRTMTSRSKGSS